jgi:methionine--tRNA ligase beta chain
MDINDKITDSRGTSLPIQYKRFSEKDEDNKRQFGFLYRQEQNYKIALIKNFLNNMKISKCTTKKENKEIKEKKENKNNENIKEEKKGKKGLDKNEIFKLCDLRVGNVKSIKIMEGFNDIYELDIDLGEGFIRKIGTGLRHYVPMEKIANSKVIVFSNLKPKRFGKNFESNGMIMCASNKINDKEVIELLRPNENSNPGDKVYLEGTELDNSKVEQITGGYYKKAIELFKTDDNCNCMFNGIKIISQSGNIIVELLKNTQIS